MTYRIDLARRAAKALDAIDKPHQRRVMAVIDRLADDPRPPQAVKVSGRDNEWRVRAGDYRVVYEVHDSRLLVLVIEEIRRAPCTVAAGMTQTTPDRPQFDPKALVAEARIGILATIKADGRPQLSPVTHTYDAVAGVITVSITEGRAKTANLRRDPRATLAVTSADGWEWATVEGVATLTGPGTDPHGPEVEALVDYYRGAAGEHPDWDEYRAAMVADRRVLMEMTVDHVYGARIR